MGLIAKERTARSILTKSRIPGADYCVNPYVGCEHACVYCYADFMARYTGHEEPWGTFVDAKANAPEVLARELAKSRKKGRAMLSSVTDPYQPVERQWGLTRRCIELLIAHGFGVDVLTKSALVLRDIDLFLKAPDLVEVGLTITTDDDNIRRHFEPRASSIQSRVDALHKLHSAGIRTYVFVGPILPQNPEALAGMIACGADSVLIDRMNYPAKSAALYRKLGLQRWLERGVMDDAGRRLRSALSARGVGDQTTLCY